MTSVTLDQLAGVVGDFAYKAPCRVVSTTNIVLSGLQTIDGVALAALDRVLVTGQTNHQLNGIYTASVTTWNLTPDFDSPQNVAKGSQVFVTDGTSYANTRWAVTTANPVKPQDPASPSSITFILVTEVIAGPITQIATGQTSQAAGARVNRITDRLFVGDAVNNNGNGNPSSGDWLTDFPINVPFDWVVSSGTLVSLTQNGCFMGGVFGALGSHHPNGFGIGMTSIAIQDQASVGTGRMWAGYLEFVGKETAGTGGVGLEIDVSTYRAVSTMNSYSNPPGHVTALWLASGGGHEDAGDAVPTSCAIGIVNNPGSFKSGIVFFPQALTGADGFTGSAEAISMAYGHEINWYCREGLTISRAVTLMSTVGTTAGAGSVLNFADDGIHLTTNGTFFGTFSATGSGNAFAFIAGSAYPKIAVTGSIADIGIQLSCKGAGVLAIDCAAPNTSATAGSASALPATPQGYMVVVVNGANRKIPLYL